MTKRFLPFIGAAALACTAMFAVTSCDKEGNSKVALPDSKLAPANIAKLQKGMDRSQVVALFGQPTQSGDVKEFGIFKKQTVNYIEGRNSLSVEYKNDEVEDFHSTVGGTTSTTTDGQTTTTTTSSTGSN